MSLDEAKQTLTEAKPDYSEQVTPASTETDSGATETDSTPEPTAPEELFDLNSVPDELKPLARSYNKGFTQKTQEVAEQRKKYEALSQYEEQGLDLAQAAALAAALQNDPVGTYNQIRDHLVQAQLLDMEPATQITPKPETIETDPFLKQLAEQVGEDDPSYQLSKRLHEQSKQLDEKLAAFSQAETDATALRAQMAEEAKVAQEDIAVRAAYPDWDDNDLNRVYDTAIANATGLSEAAQSIADYEAQIITRYINRKQERPTGTSALGGTSAGHIPEDDTPKTMRDAARLATDFVKGLENAGELTWGD
jgi:hypothetical protein